MNTRSSRLSLVALLGLLALGAGLSTAADVVLPLQFVEVGGDPGVTENKLPPAAAKATADVTPALWESVTGPITMRETEPNGTAATATPVAGTGTVVRQPLPQRRYDYYSFSATAGDRVYAATMTSFSARQHDADSSPCSPPTARR